MRRDGKGKGRRFSLTVPFGAIWLTLWSFPASAFSNTAATAPMGTLSVPEPATYILIGGTIVGLGLLQRRRRKSK
jgi:hypothetical protein